MLLHRACYHIPAQVERGLPGAYVREEFGVRCVRRTKRFITGHSTNHAAKASAQCYQDEMVLRVTSHLEGNAGELYAVSQRVALQAPVDEPDDYGVQLHALQECEHASREV